MGFVEMAVQIVHSVERLRSATWYPAIMWSVPSVTRPLMTFQVFLSLELLSLAILVDAVFRRTGKWIWFDIRRVVRTQPAHTLL